MSPVPVSGQSDVFIGQTRPRATGFRRSHERMVGALDGLNLIRLSRRGQRARDLHAASSRHGVVVRPIEPQSDGRACSQERLRIEIEPRSLGQSRRFVGSAKLELQGLEPWLARRGGHRLLKSVQVPTAASDFVIQEQDSASAWTSAGSFRIRFEASKRPSSATVVRGPDRIMR